MGKREDIIKVLKQIKPLIEENNGPISIFIAGGAGENYGLTIVYHTDK